MRKALPTDVVAILMACALIAGCTSTTIVSNSQDGSVARLNKTAIGRTGTVRLLNGEKFAAVGLRSDGDSLLFMRSSPDARIAREASGVIRLAGSDVESVRFLSRGAGALEGLGLGIGIGFVSGFVIGALAAHEDCQGFLDFNCGSPTEVGFGYAVLHGVLGAVAGPIVGAIVGKRRGFVFAS